MSFSAWEVAPKMKKALFTTLLMFLKCALGNLVEPVFFHVPFKLKHFQKLTRAWQNDLHSTSVGLFWSPFSQAELCLPHAGVPEVWGCGHVD